MADPFNLDGTPELLKATSLFNYDDCEKAAICRVTSSPVVFKPEDSFYDPEVVPPTKYRECKNYTASSVMTIHHGQRKLFVGELQFLTKVKKNDPDGRLVVVYAGAAPGHHLPFLGELFPNIEWHLYDPATFAYNNMAKIKRPGDFVVYNEYFTDEVATSWAGVADVFICDIRVGVETGPEGWSPEFEAQVAADMAAQDRWTRLMRPRLGAMLKFRPPYINAGTRLCFNYIKGRVLKQTWPSKSSTEGRLVVPPIASGEEYETMSFDIAKYQDSCAHHNIIVRPWTEYSLDASNNAIDAFKRVHGFDRCFDCVNEAAAWLDYAGSLSDPVALMMRLTTDTKQKLVNPKGDSCTPPFHGTFVDFSPTQRIIANHDNIRKAIETGYKTPHRGPTASQAFKPKIKLENSDELPLLSSNRGGSRSSSRGGSRSSSRGGSRGGSSSSNSGSSRGGRGGRGDRGGSCGSNSTVDQESFARAISLAQKLM